MRRKNIQNPDQLELFSLDASREVESSTATDNAAQDQEAPPKLINDDNFEDPSIELSEGDISNGDSDTEQVVITIPDDGGKTVGKTLRETRERLNLSISAVAEATRIRADYIEYLEADDFQKLPAASIYTKSYLKSLCREYDLPYEALRDKYENSSHKKRTPAPITVSDRILPQTRENPPEEQPAVPDKDADYESALKLAWVITGLVFSVAVIVLVYVIGSRDGINVKQGSELNTVITDSDLERFIPPEQLTFEELPLDGQD